MNTSDTVLKNEQLTTFVDYWPGNTVIGRVPAVLVCDGKIVKLIKVDKHSAPTDEVIFEATLSSISKVRGTLVMLQFYVNNNRYNAQFSRMSAHRSSIGGVIAGVDEVNNLDTKKWVSYLQAHDVDTKIHGWGWSVAVGLGLSGLIILSGVAFGFIATAAQ